MTTSPKKRTKNVEKSDVELDDVFEEGLAGDDAIPSIGDSDLVELDLDELPSLDDYPPIPESTLKKKKTRSAVVPSPDAKQGINMFDYLRTCTPPLHKKIIDISCSKAKVFGDLKDEAAQDICIVWANVIPDLSKYTPNEIASYADRIGQHTALRTKREMGSAVKLPGSAFRIKKDGTSYINPGILSDAIPWSSIETWMMLEDSADGAFKMPAELSGDLVAEPDMMSSTLVVSEESLEAQTTDARMQMLEDRKSIMTANQYNILRDLIEGLSMEEIMNKHNVKKGILLREISVAGSFLGGID